MAGNSLRGAIRWLWSVNRNGYNVKHFLDRRAGRNPTHRCVERPVARDFRTMSRTRCVPLFFTFQFIFCHYSFSRLVGRARMPWARGGVGWEEEEVVFANSSHHFDSCERWPTFRGGFGFSSAVERFAGPDAPGLSILLRPTLHIFFFFGLPSFSLTISFPLSLPCWPTVPWHLFNKVTSLCR